MNRPNPDLVLVDRMEEGAKKLINGKGGDVHALCQVVADTALVVGSMARYGCSRPCASMSWPASVSIIGSVIAVVAGVVGLFKIV